VKTRHFYGVVSLVVAVGVAASVVTLAAGKAREATATPGSVRATPPLVGPAPLPSPAMQQDLQRRAAAAQALALEGAASARAEVTSKFGVFRRPELPSDIAPEADAGDLSRQVRAGTGTAPGAGAATGPGTLTAASPPVYIVQRGTDLCVMAGGGTACGVAATQTTMPTMLAFRRADRRGETLWGAAPDDITRVDVIADNGQTVRVSPTNNAFAVDVPGTVQSVELTHADGTKSQAVGG
jgi:hypothetical protein